MIWDDFWGYSGIFHGIQNQSCELWVLPKKCYTVLPPKMARLDFGVYLLWTKPHDSCLKDIGFQYNRVEWWFRWALCYHLLKLIVGWVPCRGLTPGFFGEKRGLRIYLIQFNALKVRGCYSSGASRVAGTSTEIHLASQKRRPHIVWQLNMAGKSPIFQIFPMATLHGWGLSMARGYVDPAAPQVGASFRTEVSP